MKLSNYLLSGLLLLSILISCNKESASLETSINSEELLQNFQNPPNEAKPRVWWHWMNGNITKEGIRKDLEWMHRTGIGGFQNFDANLFTPVVVEKKLVFMEPDWKDAFKFTTDLADSLNLEMAIAGSPGWSVTGGPWVEPKDGMKKYVWSELEVEGGQTFAGKLPESPKITSSFQNVAASTGFSTDEGKKKEIPEYYADAAVVAYKLPDNYTSLASLKPKVSSSGGNFNLENLTDKNLSNGIYLPPAGVGKKTWIQYTFNTPTTFKAYTVVGAEVGELAVFNGMPENRSIEISDDGKTFKKIADIPGNIVAETSGVFPDTTSKYWRFVYETLQPTPSGIAAMFGAPTDTNPKGVHVAEFELYNTDRIGEFEDKAGFSPFKETGALIVNAATNPISKEGVVDLTAKVDAEGNLNWDVPEGRWRIIRLGYSLTGRENHPASPEATGLEVDKLDEDAVRRYINYYLDLYKDATGGKMGAEGLGYIILDSYEAGHMNWTHDMPAEFEQRRGYSILPWLPVLTGRTVESTEASEKFLWDFRKTIGEMIVDNHYTIIGEELKKRGMGRYTESHENGRVYLADGMDVKRDADIPMSAMWTPGGLAPGPDEQVRSEADIREAASVANIYGKPYVAAESMTSIMNAFSWHPEKLKRTADLELASGLNRYVIHTSVHQPLDDKMPGFSLGPFGQYFTRQETWSGAGAKAWIDYLSRSSYMLQQGKNVADVLYLYGENNNITWISKDTLPSIPQGLEFDYVNATILKADITAKDGNLVAPSDATYKVLVLDESTKEMSLGVLKKIKELQDAGVAVVGTKPRSTPSLGDDAEEFSQLVSLVASKMTSFDQINLSADVLISNTENKVLFRHRNIGKNQDIYWLNNRSENPTTLKADFRVKGKKPELWNPITGEVSELSYTINNERTVVELDLDSWGTAFIVFVDDTSRNSYSTTKSAKEQIAVLKGPWRVDFQENRGVPAIATFEILQSWTENTDENIKHFSGTATYAHTFDLAKKMEGSTYQIDLGSVKNIAEVILNGEVVGTVWKTPFTLNITEMLKSGENKLEIKVTNTWVNRLIGDAQKKPEERITFTTMPFYQGHEPLLHLDYWVRLK